MIGTAARASDVAWLRAHAIVDLRVAIGFLREVG
jgi:hypothetical protein